MLFSHRSQPVSTPAQQNATYFRALLNEIHMMLDFITSSPDRSLATLSIPDTKSQVMEGDPPVIKITEILRRLNELEARLLAPNPPITDDDQTFLQVLRDALGLMVRPASGLTIAYTTMVVGRQRRLLGRSRAEEAYGNLAGLASVHRFGQGLLMVFALTFAVVAVAESARVALGRSMLQTLQTLQAQRLPLLAEMKQAEQVNQRADNSADSKVVALLSAVPVSGSAEGAPEKTQGLQVASFKPVIRLCDRPKLIAAILKQRGIALPMLVPDTDKEGAKVEVAKEAALFDTPEQRDICDRDHVLREDFEVVHKALDKFEDDWTSFLGPAFAAPFRVFEQAVCTLRALAGAKCTEPQTGSSASTSDDFDLRIAPVLLVLGNYVLPITFALLGASVYVILDFYSKIRRSLLLPRDHILSWIRLVLGVVLGACVGLFFTTTNSAAPAGANLAESITLSASGLAFLAGFGVEGVFGLLDSLVRRVFTGDQDKGGQLSTG